MQNFKWFKFVRVTEGLYAYILPHIQPNSPLLFPPFGETFALGGTRTRRALAPIPSSDGWLVATERGGDLGLSVVLLPFD